MNVAVSDEDFKRARVLDGALKVFLSYGYKRTTMDDIARAAEMSRPALYLLFRNKADIYRAIGQRLFDVCASGVSRIMQGPGSLAERLNMAIEQAMIEMMRQISASPHGEELLDLKNELAVGMLEEWHENLAGAFGKAIEEEAQRSGVDLVARGLSAGWLAKLLLDGLEGMKQRIKDPDELKLNTQQLVRVIELAVG